MVANFFLSALISVVPNDFRRYATNVASWTTNFPATETYERIDELGGKGFLRRARVTTFEIIAYTTKIWAHGKVSHAR